MSERLLIGIVITDSHISFQEEILKGIISQAFKANCDIAVINPLHNFFNNTVHKMTERNILSLILSDKFDGFLYNRNTFCNDDIRQYIDELLYKAEKPVMLLDCDEHRVFDTMTIDDSEAFEEITDHLIKVHNKKKIYCLTGTKKNFIADERLKGYKNSLKKNGIYYDSTYYRYGDFWKVPSQELAEDIISGKLERPDAVVCGNDISAIELIKCLTAGGIRVPEDIAVTGFDASMESRQSSPTVTTYSRPNFQLGADAFRRLYRMITGTICNKIPNRHGGLYTGQSCGCQTAVIPVNKLMRRNAVNSNFEASMLYGDMLFDITNTDNPKSFADRLDNYTYFIHKMAKFQIFLTKKYLESNNGSFGDSLTFSCGDDVKMIMSKSAKGRFPLDDKYFSSNELSPTYGENRKYPVAFYVSPLNYNQNFFGYVTLSFGKVPMSFSNLYLKWINYVNVGLEQVRIRSILNKTIYKTTQALLYDNVTGLLNRNGLENEFEKYVFSKNTSFADCIRITLTDINKTYYQSGEEKCREITSAFSEVLKECAGKDSVYGIWTANSLCVIDFTCGQAENLFCKITEKLKDRQYNPNENSNIDFAMGLCTIPLNGDISLADAMHKAAVNRIFNYEISKHNTNPQFEKLCMLRSQMMKNPEQPWNISDIADKLYLSKSYLQKIYKTYFGCSIIEEMITFRIEKAKNLLIKTDLTVTEIAKKCGYSSYNYFVRQFRMSENMSPSEYRSDFSEKSD